MSLLECNTAHTYDSLIFPEKLTQLSQPQPTEIFSKNCAQPSANGFSLAETNNHCITRPEPSEKSSVGRPLTKLSQTNKCFTIQSHVTEATGRNILPEKLTAGGTLSQPKQAEGSTPANGHSITHPAFQENSSSYNIIVSPPGMCG